MTDDRDRLTTARAEYAELRAALMRGELVKLADVEREFQHAAVASRGAFLGLPSRLAGHLGLARTQMVEIESEVRDMLQAAADKGGRDD